MNFVNLLRAFLVVAVLSVLSPPAQTQTLPEFNLGHAMIAKCWAFYTWEASTTDKKDQATSLQKAASRVRARLIREVGENVGSALLTASMHTWEYLSSVVQDLEWERIAKNLHPACLEYQ